MTLLALSALIFGYCFGSIPFGLLLTRIAGLGDIRKVGSGNIGATNVLRTGRKGLAALTLLLDGGKGALAVFIASVAAHSLAAAPELAMLAAGLGAVLGHNFPIWLGFKGGKGVATTLGVVLATCWPAGLLAMLTWVVVAWLFRLSSLAALVAFAATPFYGLWFAGTDHGVLYALLAILGFIRHRANISRLWAGSESKISFKRQ